MDDFHLGSYILGIFTFLVMICFAAWIISPGIEKEERQTFTKCLEESGSTPEWCYDYSQK